MTQTLTTSIHDIAFTKNNGEATTIGEYKDKVLLIVNTASQCGLTPHYAGLEVLQKKYKENGFTVLGFPCNQFGHQEPGTDQEIATFCRTNYDITFPMSTKIEVNGDDAHPLYKFLKSEASGLLGSEAIKWNFTKFLVDRTGNVVERYAPTTSPEAIEEDILKLL